MEKLKYLFYPATLLGAELYSAYCGITRHQQNEGDIYYLYFMIFLFLVSISLIFHDLFVKKKKFDKWVIAIPMLYTLLYYFDCTFENPPLEWTSKSYQFFLFFCIPPIFIASILGNRGLNLTNFLKILDIYIIIIGIGMISYLPVMILAGGMIKGYLNISYQAALAFGYLYYNILNRPSERYGVLNSKAGRVISIFMCILLFLTCISSGGRGGAILLILFIILISCKYTNKSNMIKVAALYIPILLLTIYITSEIIGQSVLSTIFENGFQRIFSYLTTNGIDMSQTSNRDEAYELALKHIEDNIVLGNGIFHTIGKYGYPHNIFLEILEGGGIFYLTLWIVILFQSAKSFIINTFKRNKSFALFPLMLYPCVMLLFSGSYIMTGLFWFFVVFTHTKSFNSHNYET